MARCDELLRRRFIAIATDRFVADGTFPQLNVASEVATLRDWLCDPKLEDRRFEHDFERLADRPSADDIKADLVDRGAFGEADALVLYVTGHGATDLGAHRIVLTRSDPAALASTALRTSDLIEWIAQRPGLDHVLLIIDLCQAGDVASELTREVRQLIPRDWIVLLSTSPGADAKVGALTGVVQSVIEDIRSGAERDATELEPHLASHVFIARVHQLLHERHRQALTVVQDAYSTSCCLPNPRYDAGGGDTVNTTAARSDLAVLEQDMAAHWRRRAPVAGDESDGPPWVFTGRAGLMERLITATAGPPDSVVVMGRAGSGKSAVLARLVTCSDPVFRAEHDALLAQVQPVPPEGAVDIAVLATGKGPEPIVAQIGSALGVEIAPGPDQSALDSWLAGITNAVDRRGEPITVVLDALDESSDPVGVVRSVLQRLNPPDDRRIRLIVGVRSVPDDAGGDGRGRDLASLAVEALAAEAVAVDSDAYWEPGDVRSFVAQALAEPPSPYAAQRDEAAEVASTIERGVERSYLLAKLVAGKLAARDELIGPGDAALTELLAGGVAEVVRQELVTSFSDVDERERALILLRATGLGFGRGVPWRDVWPAAASAIAPRQVAIGDADVEWLLRHRMAGYLVRDLEDDVTVYRPFHDALRESLARDVDRYVAGPADHPGYAEAHGRIARALLARFDSQQQGLPPPYARRHLTEHAAAAGELDAPFLTAETLPFLDAYALSRALRLIQVEPGSALGSLLGAWRGVRHRWTWERPDSNAAALDMALMAAGAPPPQRPRRPGLSWTPRWAEWSFGGTVVGVESRSLRAIALGDVAGRACLVTAGAGEAQIWDAATSEPLGPALQASSPRQIALAPTADGEVVVAAGESGVQAWDARTGRARWTASAPRAYALAAGVVAGRRVVAAGVGGSFQLFESETGRAWGSPLGSGALVRGLALAADPSGRTRLVLGRGDGTVEQFYLDEGPSGVPIAPVIEVGAEVNAVAAASHQGDFFIATANSAGAARLWAADSGEPAGPECPHRGEVRAVVLGEGAGALLMATGSFDQLAIVWNPFAGTPSTDPMPHPGAVLDVALGVVDGRLMLATACADSNARLWDPIKPSGARVAVSGRVQRTAFGHTEEGLLLAGSAGDGRVFVWHASAGQLLREFQLFLGSELTLKRATPVPKEVAIGEVDGRTVVAASTGEMARAWDVGNGELIGELGWDGHAVSPAAVAVMDSTVLVAYPVSDEEVEVRDVVGQVRRFRVPTDRTDRSWSLTLAFLQHAGVGTVLAVMNHQSVELVDVETGLPRWPRIVTGGSAAGALGRIGSADVFAFFRDDGIGLWNLTEGTPYGPGVQHLGGKTDLAIASVGGQDLLVSGHYATVRAWHPRTGRLMTELPLGTSIASIAVSSTRDGDALVAASGPGVAVAELRAAD